MTLRHLKIFLAICDTGSTTAASEQLHIAQPTVSIALRELEAHYGVPMFERYAKRLMVTQAGRELYQYAKHLIALYDETEDAMKSMCSAGTLRVGSSITIGTCFLPAYVRRFQTLCPQTAIQAVVENTDINPDCDTDAGLAIANMTLAAWNRGVGSCIIGACNKEKLSELFGLSEKQKLHTVVAFGYPSHASRIVDLDQGGDCRYYLDEKKDYVVPKRRLSDIVKYL